MLIKEAWETKRIHTAECVEKLCPQLVCAAEETSDEVANTMANTVYVTESLELEVEAENI